MLHFWFLIGLVLVLAIRFCWADDGSAKVSELRVISGSCKINRKSKAIEISPCEKGVHLVDSFSTIDIPCKELPNVLLQGPVYLTTGSCEIYGEAETLCPALLDQRVRSSNCRTSLSPLTIVLLCITVFSVTLLGLILRWMLIVKKPKTTTGGSYLDAEFRMNYSKMIMGEPTRGIKQVSKFQILLWFFLFIKPSTSLVLLASVGDNLTVGDLTVHVAQGYYYSVLTHLHDTSDYVCKAIYWKECTWEHCVANFPCTSRPHFKRNVIKNDTLIGYEHSWCFPGEVECPITLGCKMWTTSCEFRGPTFKVYSLTPIRFYLNVTGRSNGECFLKDSKLEIMDFQLTGLVVSSSHNEHFYCPDFRPSLKFGTSKSVEVTLSMFCAPTERYGPLCDFPTNYTINHLKLDCLKLPGIYEGLQLSVHDKKLYIVAKADVRLDVDCEGSDVGYSSCGGIHMELQGMRDSPIGVVLRLAPKKHMVGFWKGHVPCYEEEMVLDCMGNGIMLPVAYDSKCLLNATYDDKTVRIYQFTNDRYTTIDSYKTVEDSSSFFTTLKAFHSTYLGISSSTLTLISWTVLVILIVRR